MMVLVAIGAAVAAYLAVVTAPPVKLPPRESVQIDGLDVADHDVLTQLRDSNLWVIPTAQALSGKTTQRPVKDGMDMLVSDHQDLDGAVGSTATALGIKLPDKTSRAPVDPSNDAASINAIRREQGTLLQTVIADRVVTDNAQIRDIDNQATLALERGIGYTEATGLVDYASLNSAAQNATVDVDLPAISATIAVLVTVAVLSFIFIRLLLRRRPKGSA